MRRPSNVLPDVAEPEALTTKINSYGKTWQRGMTGTHGGSQDTLPVGPPRLQWSFNRDGEARPDMVFARDTRMGFNTADTRSPRAAWASLARPQGGVNAMQRTFTSAHGAPAGVLDNGDAATSAIPRVSLGR